MKTLNDSRTLKEKRTELDGLCSTCIHTEDCIYAHNSESIILQCEEFDGYEEVKKSRENFTGTVRNKNEEEMTGLCANCANRDSCTFSKPEGGVWHCEEYR